MRHVRSISPSPAASAILNRTIPSFTTAATTTGLVSGENRQHRRLHYIARARGVGATQVRGQSATQGAKDPLTRGHPVANGYLPSGVTAARGSQST